MSVEGEVGEPLKLVALVQSHITQGVEARTGIGPSTNGIDISQLAASQSGVATNLAQTAASARLEMIARSAASGLEQVFQKALRILVRHQTEVRTIQRVGKPPIVLDPQSWAPNANVSLRVAMATASRQAHLAHLSTLAQVQEKILLTLGQSNPVVDIAQYSNTLADITEVMGFRNSERYFHRISAEQAQQMAQQQPQHQDPKVVKATMEAQTAHDQMTAEQTRLDEIAQHTQERADRQASAEMDLKRRIAADELNLARNNALAKLQLDREIAGLRRAAGLSPGYTNGSTTPNPVVHVGGEPG